MREPHTVVKGTNGDARSRPRGQRRLGPSLLVLAIALLLPMAARISTSTGPQSPSAASTAKGPFAATADGVSMDVSLANTVVSAGDSVNVSITITNSGSAPIVYVPQECGSPAAVRVTVQLGTQAFGREWSGAEGDVKARALSDFSAKHANGVPVEARPATCNLPPERWSVGEQQLGVGESLSADATWTAEFVPGVSAPAGPAVMTAVFAYDTGRKPRSHRSGPYKGLSVDGPLTVLAGTSQAITAGEAVDAVLADADVASFVRESPRESLSGLSVFLQYIAPETQGIVPGGPSWEIDIIREEGVSREWAIGFVDPATGMLRSVSFCRTPCDR